MKLGKHFAGVALFFVIFASTVIVTNFLTAPIGTVSPIKLNATPPGHIVDMTPQPINYKVRLVSLDFNNGKSYTTLILKREAGQPAPEKLWVRTLFFAPDHDASKGWSSLAEIRRPFSYGERVEITATGKCDWCEERDAPKAGYYAQVYVSTEYAGDLHTPAERASRNIMTAIPVVVQTKRKTNPFAAR